MGSLRCQSARAYSGVGNPQYQGTSVSISSDGNTAIVGGPGDNSNKGATWVFTRSGGVWSQLGSKLVGTDSVGYKYQGVSVSLSSDGNTAIVGGTHDSDHTGAAWIWTRSGGVWSQQGSKLVGTGAVGYSYEGGISVSLSSDGNTAIVGGFGDNHDTGAVWIWTRSGGVWSQLGSKLVGTGAQLGGAKQGASVSLSSDGNTAIVGGIEDYSGRGAAWIFTQNASTSILPIKSFISRLNIANGNSLQFSLPQYENVAIQLFNAKGKTLSQLLNDSRKAGLYNIPLPNETKGSYYLLDYRSGNYHETLKIRP